MLDMHVDVHIGIGTQDTASVIALDQAQFGQHLHIFVHPLDVAAVDLVEVRQGDRTMQVIPQGPIGVDTTEIDATLSWSDGNTHAVVAMPLTGYERHLATGSIRVDASPPA